ncbi:hypothetical protein AB4K20DRAFT_1901003 [Rhizopus microsporus]
MQQLGNSLDSIGYIFPRKLLDHNSLQIKESTLPAEVLCHYFDILISDPNEFQYPALYEQFKKVIHSPISIPLKNEVLMPPKRQYVKNDKRRRYLIEEFIKTEANYLTSLKTFVLLIVEPLRQFAKDRHNPIIGQYECSNIFMNIDEIIQVTEEFYRDLISDHDTNLGNLCSAHLRQFSCYNKFLSGIHNARILNEKQLKNPHYVEYLEAANEQMKSNQTVYDYLALPIQRIGRYTMYFKELLKHTADDHADLPGLHQALLKAEEIANMTEEAHTQALKIFSRLLLTIHACPESLINSHRRFLCYLDVAQLDIQTMKHLYPVTLFLFSDKIMVVRRPSYDTDGLDLCGLDQRLYEGSEKLDFCISRDTFSSGKLKFLGWISLADISLHEGPLDASFTLLCNHTGVSPPSSDNTDEKTQKSLEAYFQQDHAHIFSLSQSGNFINKQYLHTVEKALSYFAYQFGKARNECRTAHEGRIDTMYCQWNRHHFFTNIYSMAQYNEVPNKSEIVLFYTESNTIDVESILSNNDGSPNMVGFVVPHERDNNYRFAIRSKCAIGNTKNSQVLLTFRASDGFFIHDARNLLFGNLLACDRDLQTANRIENAKHLRYEHSSSHDGLKFVTKQDLKRKKSRPTFKLFSSLAGHSSNSSNSISSSSSSSSSSNNSSSIAFQGPSSPTTATSSFNSKQKASYTHNDYLIDLEASYCSKRYSTGSSSCNSSIRSHRSIDSKSTLQSINSSSSRHRSEKQPTPDLSELFPVSKLGKLGERHSDVMLGQQRQLSPSVHPTRTASCEILSAARKERGILETVFSTSDLHRPPSSIGNSSREPTPVMTESGESSINSRQSTLSTMNSQRSLYQQMFDTPPTPVLKARPASDLLIPIAAPDDSQQMHVRFFSGFKKPVSDTELHIELEEKNRTIIMLNSLLQKKDQEISMLKADLEDSVSELGTVCDKFNLELDNLARLYEHMHYDNNLDNNRPHNPSAEAQLRRMLEVTMKERNQWQLKAIELERKLKILALENDRGGNSGQYNTKFTVNRQRHSYHGPFEGGQF